MTIALHVGGDTVALDEDQLARLDVPGPRYTSYPTAPQWDNDFGPEDAQAALAASNGPATPDGQAAPLSLYSHLPFCEHRCLYCGCNVIVEARHERAVPYLGTLKREIQLIADQIDTARPVVQFAWGGGTPTYYTPAELEDLFGAVAARFTFAPDAEISVELDPRTATAGHLATLRRLGFNRLSLGVQDFEPATQRAVGRVQPYEEVRDLVAGCREYGFESISFDLIYGLPFQTPETFRRTLDLAAGLGPDRLSVFSYGHVPWVMPHQRALDGKIPLGVDKFRLFATALEVLQDQGYRYIGMDHFARPTDELSRAQEAGTLHRNFQGYTTKAGADVIGLGVTGISGLGRAYIQNHRDLAGYADAIDHGRLATLRGMALTDDDVARRETINQIMCHGRIDRAAFGARLGIDFDKYFAPEIESLAGAEEQGLVVVTPEAIQATPLGQVFIRLIAMRFDSYLAKDRADGGPRYSQTV